MALQLVPATGQVLFTTFSALYQGAYEKVPTFYQDFSTVMPSNSETQLYHWIAQLPGMKEWIGERQLNNAVLRNYSLTNKNYEDSVKLDKFKVADDQWGAFGQTVQAFGDAVARWQDQQMAAIVEASATTLCYDGQYFIDTDHPVSLTDSYATGLDGVATFSNKLDGAAYDFEADPIGAWNKGRAQMASFVGDAGQPLGLMADTVMVPPSLELQAIRLAQAEITTQTFAATGPANASIVAAASQSNVNKGKVNYIVNPYLTTKAAYVMCSTRPIKPFVWQLRQAPVFTSLVDPTLPNMFVNREFIYGAEARGCGGYSLPQLCVRLAAS